MEGRSSSERATLKYDILPQRLAEYPREGEGEGEGEKLYKYVV